MPQVSERGQFERLMADPAALRDEVLIDTDDGPKPYGPNLDQFQRDDFAEIDVALRRVLGQDVESNQRIYLERPRGHSKTTDIAFCVVCLLFSSVRKLALACCAGDQQQATLILDAIATMLRLRPWLAQVLEVQRDKVINKRTGSTLTVLSSDAATSYGLLLDAVIVDELTHWKRRDLWDAMFSTAAKRKHCLLLVISNAGFSDSWQGKLRNQIVDDPSWTFRRLEGPVASWIDAERLDEQRRIMPPKSFGRLWLNQWSDGSGDALDADDFKAALKLSGPLTGPERGWAYIGGLDLGVVRDCTAAVILGKHVGYMDRSVRKPRPLVGAFGAMADLGLVDAPADEIKYTRVPGTGELKVVAVRIWNPKSGRVQLDDVQQEILALHRQFKLTRLAFDPWQCELMAQNLAKAGVYCAPISFTPTNLQSMAAATLEAFRERRIALFDHPELLADMRSMRVVEKSHGGYRLEWPRGVDGATHHGDAGQALALAIESARAIRGDSTLHANRRLVYN
jgi:phage terminase large subunit-like protein